MKIGVALLLALTVLAVVIEFRSGRELATARSALEQSDSEAALRHFTRAMSWYLPFGSAETAAEEMLDLGLKWAREGRTDDAARALGRCRGWLYGARSFFTPRRDLIEKAEPVLARLRAEQKLGPQASAQALDRKTALYLELMRRPGRPYAGPALAVEAGFAVWVLAALLFIFRFYVPKAAGPVGNWSRAWPWIPVFFIGYIIWLWGMKWA